MGTRLDLTPQDLQDLLGRARDAQASASLRAVGVQRILGDLHVGDLEPGTAVHLMGAKRRDQLPGPGTPLNLSLLLGENVFTIRTSMLEPIVTPEGDGLQAPILRVAWPLGSVERYHRESVRVAASDLPPLSATARMGADWVEAQLLNLTETGMGLGMPSSFAPGLHSQVEVQTTLPGGILFRTMGEVRHLELLDEGPFPARLGLVLGCMTGEGREAMRQFIQARRTDRSQMLRSES
jgi:hypothetical protein